MSWSMHVSPPCISARLVSTRRSGLMQPLTVELMYVSWHFSLTILNVQYLFSNHCIQSQNGGMEVFTESWNNQFFFTRKSFPWRKKIEQCLHVDGIIVFFTKVLSSPKQK